MNDSWAVGGRSLTVYVVILTVGENDTIYVSDLTLQGAQKIYFYLLTPLRVRKPI